MVGCWIIGAGGAVAATTVALAGLLKQQLLPSIGLLTEQKTFSDVQIVGVDGIVFGGHEICEPDPIGVLRGVLRTAGKEDLLEPAVPYLNEYSSHIRKGFAYKHNSAFDPACILDALVSDINSFKEEHKLKYVVVVNLATTEPPSEVEPETEEEMFEAFRSGMLPESSVYAWAACEAGCGYVNFTPSTGCYLPPLRELFKKKRLPYAGRDGKTGETLVKTALAHMFEARAMRVLSWAGFNILGNADGRSLSEEKRKASKCDTKGAVLPRLLGYTVRSCVGIEFVEPLGDRKVAWDHIIFEGAFGVRMSLQFVWEGVDSVLASPLVLDLVRFMAIALSRGESGYQKHLALYFKDVPPDCPQHLFLQYQELVNYARRLSSGRRG